MSNYLIAGGGTGGHIFPAVAIGEAIRQRASDARIYFVGTRYGMEKDLIPKLGYPLLTLPIRGLLGKSLANKAALLWRLPLSMMLSLYYLIRYRPKVVIGVGGYASGPLLWMAGILRFATMIQEQNAFPGLANRLSSKLTKLACCGFAEAAPRLSCPAVVTGNPVRAGFGEARAWSPERKTLLILGGSQGARALNETLPDLLAKVIRPEHGIEVIHQCGRRHQEAVEKAYHDAPFKVQVTPFIEDMSAAMNAARFMICRAGASTIAELKLAGVPAVLVPFPAAAHDHQTFNARSLADSGAALLIPEEQLAGAGDRITALLEEPDRLATMAAAHSKNRPDSAGLCAEIAFALQNHREVDAIVKEYAHVS